MTTKMVTPNNNGVFQSTPGKKKGKTIDTVSYDGIKLYSGNGTLITDDVSPEFQGWTYTAYMQDVKKKRIKYLEPMSAHEDKNYLYREIVASDEVAELKMDGHRATVHMGREKNRMFSRSNSKVTGWLGENTDQVPHVRDLILPEYEGTVLDGEFDYGTTSMGVQSVMGALPENALQYQFNNRFIDFFAFDILYYKGINVQKMPLWKRKIYLMEVIQAFLNKYGACHMHFTQIYVTDKSASSLMQKWAKYLAGDDIRLAQMDNELITVSNFRDTFKELVAEEREGMIVKDINGIYEQKRSKAFIKLKGESTWDCVIMGLKPPTKEYEGKEIGTWKYWEMDGELTTFSGQAHAVQYADMSGTSAIPVSKPYYMGWCGAIDFGVFKTHSYEYLLDEYGAQGLDIMIDNGEVEPMGDGNFREIVNVGYCKGLTESLQQDLKENWEGYVRNGRVLEVKANGILDEETGSLRHPRFGKWRDDKSAEDCVWEDHIRKL